MPKAVPADAQCHVTHCHHYTPVGYPQQQDCITAVNFLSYPLQVGKNKKNRNSRLRSSRFMCNKKERSVVLLLLLVLLILLLPPSKPPKKAKKKTTTTSIITNATTTTTTTTKTTTTGELQQ